MWGKVTVIFILGALLYACSSSSNAQNVTNQEKAKRFKYCVGSTSFYRGVEYSLDIDTSLVSQYIAHFKSMSTEKNQLRLRNIGCEYEQCLKTGIKSCDEKYLTVISAETSYLDTLKIWLKKDFLIYRKINGFLVK